MNEISHREIYERLVAVEKKVDRVEENTAGMVKAFEAASGAFLILEWFAKFAKPLIVIGTFIGGLFVAIQSFKFK
jgi:hypothetical protein